MPQPSRRRRASLSHAPSLPSHPHSPSHAPSPRPSSLTPSLPHILPHPATPRSRSPFRRSSSSSSINFAPPRSPSTYRCRVPAPPPSISAEFLGPPTTFLHTSDRHPAAFPPNACVHVLPVSVPNLRGALPFAALGLREPHALSSSRASPPHVRRPGWRRQRRQRRRQRQRRRGAQVPRDL